MNSQSDPLDRLTKFPLLSPEEEIVCGRAVQEMQRLLELNPSGPYTKQERKTIRIGTRAKDRLVTGNIRWVFTMARKFLPLAKTLNYDDLVQDGTLGLIRAVEKFDPGRGYKFSTYSFWWIRQGITRGLAADRMIRLPSNASDLLRKIVKCRDQHYDAFGKMPSFDEISEQTGISAAQVKLLIERANDATSLDQRVLSRGSESSTIGELIACDQSSPWDYAIEDEIFENAWFLLGKIRPERSHILSFHYGMTSEEPNGYTRNKARAAVKSLKVLTGVAA